VKNRPRKKQTLVNHARAFLGKDTKTEAVELVVAELQAARHLDNDDKGAVSFRP